MSTTEPRRRVPSVDVLLRSDPGKRAARSLGRPVVKLALQRTLEEVRAAVERGAEPLGQDEILARALALASDTATGLTPVVNATGVVLHTGLGRAPLPETAARAAARAALGYSDLEVDRVTGRRGRRTARAELLLRSLTVAVSALVVNNGAAVRCRAPHGKQARSARRADGTREFRIPDIMAASGARLVEVGTTNRTRASDYRSALSDKTALILKVHPSNYRSWASRLSLSSPTSPSRTRRRASP
jgi:L-seryl-tRNA(Ser) seleniumtransferase